VGDGLGEREQRNAAVVAALRALSFRRLGRERARRLLLAGSLVVAGGLVPILGAPYRLHEQRLAQEDALVAKRARAEARCAVLAKRREEIQRDMLSELYVAGSERARAETRTEAARRVHDLLGLRAEAGCLTARASVNAAPAPSIPASRWPCPGDPGPGERRQLLLPAAKVIVADQEAMHSLYRTRGRERAKVALGALTDRLAASALPELQTLRRTLIRWRHEILEHFATGLTNARTEGFNNKAKLVKKRAYGYRSFRNYRLRLLNACA
jgi:hypothetical protein